MFFCYTISMKYFFGAICISLASVLFVHAQTAPQNALVTIKQTPESPNEGENVTLTVSTYAFDINSSQIVWSVDGKIKSQGTGLKTITQKAPINGNKSVVDIQITSLDGKKYSKSITLAPQDLDLLWEATDSYVSPFYKGKALPAEQALVKFVAIPNFVDGGKELDRTKTAYYWKRANKSVQSVSGFGKNSYLIMLDYLTEGENIEVSAQGVGTNAVAKRNVYITPTEPEILIYESNPLLGTIYSKTFTRGVKLGSSEITFVAEPFGFSGKNKLYTALDYLWTVNGETSDAGENPNRITVRTPEEGKGESLLKIQITSKDKILQEKNKEIPLKF